MSDQGVILDLVGAGHYVVVDRPEDGHVHCHAAGDRSLGHCHPEGTQGHEVAHQGTGVGHLGDHLGEVGQSHWEGQEDRAFHLVGGN